MKQYIHWFIEEFLGKGYIDKETLGLWMIQRKKFEASGIKKINVPHRHEEQMTIFDLVS
ncbi:hypothetical protein [Staphylococcus capitis]|uniref:hypothetical protein n=1 Tax=Staphylococcus capitis TaxID=29388 RepID=UPI0013003BB3|nr:hypothetical protein [Staphylococcus capitis]